MIRARNSKSKTERQMTKFKHFVGERDRQKQIAGRENILRERPAADYGRLNDGKRERGWKRKEVIWPRRLR